jgi:hypothetical protein
MQISTGDNLAASSSNFQTKYLKNGPKLIKEQVSNFNQPAA